MSKFINASEMFDVLHQAGVIEDRPEYVRRVVIDLKADGVGMVYVEMFADSERLFVALEGGLKVVTE